MQPWLFRRQRSRRECPPRSQNQSPESPENDNESPCLKKKLKFLAKRVIQDRFANSL